MFNRRDILKAGIVTAGTLGFAGLPLISSAAKKSYGIVGQQAPELDIDYWINADGNNTSFKLSMHRDKWILLKCFQSWCPGCHSYGFPALKKMSDALKDNPKVVFAGIQTVFEGFSVNTKEKMREIQLQYDLKVPMGHDPGKHQRSQTMIDYRTGGTPWMILINPQGQVVFNHFQVNPDKVIELLKTQTA